MREDEDNAQAGDEAADDGAGEPEYQLVHGLAQAGERDKKARDDCGAHPGPVEKRIDRVRNHDRHRGLQGKLPMRWITERVGDEGSSRRMMRFSAFRLGIGADYGIKKK